MFIGYEASNENVNTLKGLYAKPKDAVAGAISFFIGGPMFFIARPKNTLGSL